MRQYRDLKIPDILDGEDKEEKHKIEKKYIYIYKKLQDEERKSVADLSSGGIEKRYRVYELAKRKSTNRKTG